MARDSSTRRRSRRHNSSNSSSEQPPPPHDERRVAEPVRQHQRAVAEREAARLARPERRVRVALAHADPSQSAVSSTPFGRVRGATTTTTNKNTSVSSNGWCGPFSVARELIAQREALKRQREDEQDTAMEAAPHPLDEIMQQVALEQDKKAHPSMTWKSCLPVTTTSSSSKTTSLYAKRQKRMAQRTTTNIPTLAQLCVDFVVQHFDHVESLGEQVPHDVRVAITHELAAQHLLTGTALTALLEPSLETLELSDGAGIGPDDLAHALRQIPQLRYLLVTHAGRCLGPRAVDALLEVRAPLCCVAVAGAYLLTDVDAARLIRGNATTLQSISFDTCPLLGLETLQAIREQDGKLLELSLKEMTFSKEALQALVGPSSGTLATAHDNKNTTTATPFSQLQSLTLSSLTGLTDDLVSTLLAAAGDHLHHLDLSYNFDLTDDCLSAIRQHNPRLVTLRLEAVQGLSAAGLETLFTSMLPGLPPPPPVKVLQLASCSHGEAVTDQLLQLVTTASSGMNGGLVQLDIAGATSCTDSLLERLVETSASTLTELNVSYCPLISNQGLGYLVSKMGRQLRKITIWGCAQISDEFLDGHDRVADRSLEIVGAWMKKSGMRSLR